MLKTEEELVKDGAWGGTLPDTKPRSLLDAYVMAMCDPVNHPAHYTSGSVECIDAIDSAVKGLEGYQAVYTAQIIKYVYRWRRKGGVEDLKKAKWYLERLIEKTEKGDA